MVRVRQGRRDTEIDLLTIGRVYIDIQYFVDGLPSSNKAGEILEIFQGCGGCPGNVAVAAARLGLRTAVCAKVGTDEYGAMYINRLKSENVDASCVSSDSTKPTGMSVIMVDRKGTPAIVRRLGVNTELSMDDVETDLVKKAKWLHIAATSNISVPEETSNIAKKAGVTISFDPGRSMSRLGYKKLNKICHNIDVLIVNREEAGNIINMPYNGFNFKEIFSKLIGTLGEDRLYIVKSGAEPVYGYSMGEDFLVKPFKVKVVDTLGAGDAFDAGVIAGLIWGRSLEESIKYGNAVAALKIMKKGTQSLPYSVDVESFLKTRALERI